MGDLHLKPEEPGMAISAEAIEQWEQFQHLFLATRPPNEAATKAKAKAKEKRKAKARAKGQKERRVSTPQGQHLPEVGRLQDGQGSGLPVVQ
eukprot:812868-Lingulodinium_polyedra.AAC.1